MKKSQPKSRRRNHRAKPPKEFEPVKSQHSEEEILEHFRVFFESDGKISLLGGEKMKKEKLLF